MLTKAQSNKIFSAAQDFADDDLRSKSMMELAAYLDSLTEEPTPDTATVLDWLEEEVSATDTWHRGGPTYEHDAGWMKALMLDLIEMAREIFSDEQEPIHQTALMGAAVTIEGLKAERDALIRELAERDRLLAIRREAAP